MLSALVAHRAAAGLGAVLLATASTPLSDHAVVRDTGVTGSATVDVDTTTTTPTALRAGAGMAWTSGDNTADPVTGALHPAMVQALAVEGVRALRFPSGMYSNCYDWRRGVGPLASRPDNLDNWSATGTVGCYAYNGGDGFGTDEFMGEVAELSRLEGQAVDPIVTVNICSVSAGGTCGSGGYPPICPDPTSSDVSTGCPGALLAAQWVEYLNGATSTRYGAMRASDSGHTTPYGVHWFEIGNETHIAETASAPLYSNVLRTYAQQMRAVDPSIGIIAQGDCICTQFPSTLQRDKVLASTVGDVIDGIAPHIYPDAGDSTGQVDSYLAGLQGVIRGAGLPARVEIMPTEWAAIDNREATVDSEQLFGDLRAGLNDATDLLAFLRNGVGDTTFFTVDGAPYQMLHCADDDPADAQNECAAPQVPPYESIPGQVLRMLQQSLQPRTAAVSTSGVIRAAASVGAAAVSVDMVNTNNVPLSVTVSVTGGLPHGTALLRGMAGGNLAEDLARTPSDYPAATTTVVPVELASLAAAGQMAVTLPADSVAVLTVPLLTVSSGIGGAISTPLLTLQGGTWWRRAVVATLR